MAAEKQPPNPGRENAQARPGQKKLVWLGRAFALEMMVLLHFTRGLLGL